MSKNLYEIHATVEHRHNLGKSRSDVKAFFVASSEERALERFQKCISDNCNVLTRNCSLIAMEDTEEASSKNQNILILDAK